jgi:hypothetical protein
LDACACVRVVERTLALLVDRLRSHLYVDISSLLNRIGWTELNICASNHWLKSATLRLPLQRRSFAQRKPDNA